MTDDESPNERFNAAIRAAARRGQQQPAPEPSAALTAVEARDLRAAYAEAEQEMPADIAAAVAAAPPPPNSGLGAQGSSVFGGAAPLDGNTLIRAAIEQSRATGGGVELAAFERVYRARRGL